MSWAGTILRVDLTEGRIEKEPTSRYVKDYIGDAGIATSIFWEGGAPGYADAYGNIFSYADILGVSPRKVQELIDQWCNEASKRLMVDPNLWRKPKYDKRIGPWMIEKETEFILGDITSHCEVMSPYLEHYGIKFGTTNDNTRWLAAAMGIKYTADELRQTASRIRILIDAYNVLCARLIGEKPVAAKPVETLFSFPQAGRPTDPEELAD